MGPFPYFLLCLVAVVGLAHSLKFSTRVREASISCCALSSYEASGRAAKRKRRTHNHPSRQSAKSSPLSSTTEFSEEFQRTEEPKRRQRGNKYAHFSRADEVKKTLRFSSFEELDSADADVPLEAESRIRERNVWLYPDASEVDQNDPSTFGFTEIGYVCGAHGTRGEVRVTTDSDFGEERLCQPGTRWLRRTKRRAPREVEITSGRPGPGTRLYLVQIDGVVTRDQAAELKGATLFVRREVMPALSPDEVLLWQLEGLAVHRAVRVSTPEASADEAPAIDGEPRAESATDGEGATDAEGAPALARASAGSTGTQAAAAFSVGEEIGVVVGVVPREELTGSPTLGNDLLEVALGREPDADTILVPYVEAIVPEIRLEQKLLLIDPPDGLMGITQPKRTERIVIRGLLPQRALSLLSPDEA